MCLCFWVNFFVVSISLLSLSRYDSHRISFVCANFLFDFQLIAKEWEENWQQQKKKQHHPYARHMWRSSKLIMVNEFRFVFHVAQNTLRCFHEREIFALIIVDATAIRMRFGQTLELLTMTVHTHHNWIARSPSSISAQNVQFSVHNPVTWSGRCAVIVVTMELCIAEPIENAVNVYYGANARTRRVSNRISCTNEWCRRAASINFTMPTEPILAVSLSFQSFAFD